MTRVIAPVIAALLATAVSSFAQDASPRASAPNPPAAAREPQAPQNAAPQNAAPQNAAGKTYLVDTGTRVPLSLINSVSTKNAVVGDRIYLESVFPILAGGRIVIPPGSYVAGTITDIKRPGRVKGRGEFHLRFDSLTLPNGTTRDFRGQIAGLDGRSNDELDRKEGSIRSEGNKSGDVRAVGESNRNNRFQQDPSGCAGVEDCRRK